jgi:hypothetical protein
VGFHCEGGFSFSECSTEAKYVLPAGTGLKDGSNWANAFDGLPDRLERDTVYWLGAGSYDSYTFDDTPSAQAGITLRKATAQVHGASTGWNAQYGSGQAVFGPLRFSTERYTLEGGEPNGIQTVGRMGTEAVVRFDGGRIVLRQVEINGGFRRSDNTQTGGACIGGDIDADYVMFDRCEIHNTADDGIGIYASHIKVLNSKIHDLHGCGTDSDCSGPCYNGHSDGLEISRASDIELIGNMVYEVRSTAAIFMEDWGRGGVSDLVAYNNVFYTPATGLTVYLQDLDNARFHNNIIWGRTQGNRYGGLSIGNDVTNLEMRNNIILNINYSHMNAQHDPSQHDLDYNLFAMIDSREYSRNTHDLVGDPMFRGISVSDQTGDHEGSDLRIDDFVPTAGSPAIDSGTILSGLPEHDILGRPRSQGIAWDRGPIEVEP